MAYLQFISNDYFQSVANSEIDGTWMVNVNGKNPDVDAAAGEDIWYFGGASPVFVPPTAARIHNIVSSSTADDGSPTGTGAWTVIVTGLDGSYAVVSETITMNGTTNVVTNNSYVFIYELRVDTAGSAGGNVGNITATAQVDGTLSCAMEATTNRSHTSIFMVPDGYNAFIYAFNVSMANTVANAHCEFKLKSKATGANKVWVELENDITKSENQRWFIAPRKFVPRDMIKGFAVADTNNTIAEFSYTVILQSI